jgi:hypothetical protein
MGLINPVGRSAVDQVLEWDRRHLCDVKKRYHCWYWAARAAVVSFSDGRCMPVQVVAPVQGPHDVRSLWQLTAGLDPAPRLCPVFLYWSDPPYSCVGNDLRDSWVRWRRPRLELETHRKKRRRVLAVGEMLWSSEIDCFRRMEKDGDVWGMYLCATV